MRNLESQEICRDPYQLLADVTPAAHSHGHVASRSLKKLVRIDTIDKCVPMKV